MREGLRANRKLRQTLAVRSEPPTGLGMAEKAACPRQRHVNGLVLDEDAKRSRRRGAPGREAGGARRDRDDLSHHYRLAYPSTPLALRYLVPHPSSASLEVAGAPAGSAEVTNFIMSIVTST